ncbi:hypothetical protein HDV03_000886, partial [Kappamyces sp. JEL0829]
SGRRFNSTIRTDGTSCCVVLELRTKPVKKTKKRKRTHKSSKEADQPSEYFQDNLDSLRKNLVVIAPNRRDLLYCQGIRKDNQVEGDKIFKKNTLRYTQMQRRRESYAKQRRKIMERMETDHGLRGTDGERGPTVPILGRKPLVLDEHVLYLKCFFSTFADSEQVNAEPVFRQLRFKGYVCTQRSQSQFINKVEAVY